MNGEKRSQCFDADVRHWLPFIRLQQITVFAMLVPANNQIAIF